MDRETLAILLLEDEKSDIELLQYYLNENLNYNCHYRITHKKEEYRLLLKRFKPDLIIADYTMPSFTGMEALEILRSEDDLTPFIFVTGTIGEENAVNALLSGATDFIVKNRMEYLPAAVLRARKEYKQILYKKQSEEKLKQTYRQVKTAQRLAKIGYWDFEFNKKTFTWTNEVYHIWERDQTEFMPTAKSVSRTIEGEDINNLLDRDYQLYQQFSHLDTEHCIRTPTGKRKWIKNHIAVIRNEKGEPERLEGAVQDISDEKDIQKELQLSNERFRMALKAASEAIWDWDIVKDRLILGQGFETLLGEKLSDENQPSEFWLSRIFTEDLDHFRSRVMETLIDKESDSYNIEYRIYRADGSIAHVVDRAHIKRDESGKAVRGVGAILDLSETKKLLKDIQQQNQQLKEIAWIQSHIVRAPLARIMGLVSLLEMDDHGMSNAELINHINTSARELDGVIRDIVGKANELNKLSDPGEGKS